MFTPKQIFAEANDAPIITSVLDTDFYKFLMAYFIWSHKEYRNAEVTFRLKIRDTSIRLADIIPEAQLRAHLDADAKLRMTDSERAYLQGMTLDNGDLIFGDTQFLKEFQDLGQSPYELKKKGGDYELSFTGPWWQVSQAEIRTMRIISELYYWNLIQQADLSDREFKALYAKMFLKLNTMINTLWQSQAKVCEFGTRRAHSALWHWIAYETVADELGTQCVGTSNVLFSMRRGGANPKGTNAHELPMVAAALAGDDHAAIVDSQYKVVRQWFSLFGHDLLILLPDTYGTTQFLENAPEWMAAQCKGIRLDSKDPHAATPEAVEWWRHHDVDPKTKMLIPSDGLTAEKVVELHHAHGHKVASYPFGVGTNWTNACRDVWPRGRAYEAFRPFSMVMKAVEANGVSCVKLSDNPGKAMGDPDRVMLFKTLFGVKGFEDLEISV